MVCALAAPATADYIAEHKNMSIYKQGAGDLMYTYGTPFYQCIWNYNADTGTSETATYSISLESVPENAVEARLYVYWTWSKFDEYDPYSSKDYGVYPELAVEFNGALVSFDRSYTDVKNSTYFGLHYGDPNYLSYNFPAGTNCAMIPIAYVDSSNVVNVTNVYPYNGDDPDTSGDDMAKVCIQGVGLLLTLADEDKMYWIAEGNDMTYCKWTGSAWTYGITPDMTITRVKFPGAVPAGMDTATLTSVVPAGDLGNNRLYFNALDEYWWDGLWNGVPDGNLAVSETDVSDALRSQNNMARFQNGLENPNSGDRQMNVANAFLVVA